MHTIIVEKQNIFEIRGHKFHKEIRKEKISYQKKANWGSLMLNKTRIDDVIYFVCETCNTCYKESENGIPANISSCEQVIMERILG